MAHSNGVISAPVSILSDLRTVLGTGLTDLGQIVTQATIKEWAKYKPVRRNKQSALTASDREAAHHGFSIPGIVATDRPYNLLSYYNGSLNGWQYDRPRGASQLEWFRLLDFNGYTNNPQNPLKNYDALPSVVYDSQTTTSFQVAGFLGLSDSAGRSVELADFPAVLAIPSGSLYFGVALFKGTGLTPTTAMSAACEIATSGGPITKNSDGTTYAGTTVSFAKTGMTGNHKGIWTVVPFLCNGAITQRGAWSGGTFLTKNYYPLPFASITQIEVTSSQDSYTITFVGTKTAVYLNAEIEFINQSSAARTLTVSAFFWDSSVAGTPDTRAKQSYELQFDKTVTIPGNSTVTWTLPESFTRYDSRLLQYGVAYIRVSGESEIRGPFGFRKIDV